MGIAVSLDDFGTGFSSLSTIGELHIDTVKIDRFFISRISRLPDLIMSDIISMAHKIGLLVVAEGVEDERQEAYLRKHGCDIIQGYLISRPLAEQDAVAFLRDYNDSEREQ
jgi:EAL domain-containing protein (putative c-di-GMP-specific phosphodiesterase class I)